MQHEQRMIHCEQLMSPAMSAEWLMTAYPPLRCGAGATTIEKWPELVSGPELAAESKPFMRCRVPSEDESEVWARLRRRAPARAWVQASMRFWTWVWAWSIVGRTDDRVKYKSEGDSLLWEWDLRIR